MQLELGSSSLDQVWPCERCALTVLLSGPGYFWILLAGQVVSSILNVLEWGAPSYISAVWFPPNERAFATTMVAATAPQASNNFSVFLMSLGRAVGGNIVVSVAESFGSPSRQHGSKTLVSRTSPEFLQWQDNIQAQMFYYLLGQAVFASIIVPLTFCKSPLSSPRLQPTSVVLPEAPPTPPSVSRHVEGKITNVPLYTSFVDLLKNIKFLFFSVVFSKWHHRLSR